MKAQFAMALAALALFFTVALSAIDAVTHVGKLECLTSTLSPAPIACREPRK